MTVGTVVCRSRINCGKTQTDSRMMENDHKTYIVTLQQSLTKHSKHPRRKDPAPYLVEMSSTWFLIDKRHKGRGKHGTSQRNSPQLPSPLSLSCSGVNPHHQIDDIKRRRDVKDLKHKVPHILVRMRPEQVEVSRTEHGCIEHLRYQWDT